jgi:hypothetical protein
VAAFSQVKLSTNIPHVERQGLGAKSNNSSASSMEYLPPL